MLLIFLKLIFLWRHLSPKYTMIRGLIYQTLRSRPGVKIDISNVKKMENCKRKFAIFDSNRPYALKIHHYTPEDDNDMDFIGYSFIFATALHICDTLGAFMGTTISLIAILNAIPASFTIEHYTHKHLLQQDIKEIKLKQKALVKYSEKMETTILKSIENNA